MSSLGRGVVFGFGWGSNLVPRSVRTSPKGEAVERIGSL